jgi:lipopolysaccharide transport system permease protein
MAELFEPNQAASRTQPTRWIYGPFGPLARHAALVWILVWTGIKSTYARAALGLFWLILFPLFYVTVFVAIRVFLFDASARSPDWEGEVLGIADIFMLGFQIFIGFNVFWIASDIISRSAGAVTRNSSYVQDSVFPLEALPWVTIGLAIFNFALRVAMFAVAYIVIVGTIQPTILLLPVVVAPLILMMIGAGFFLAATGVFIRDLEYVIGVMTTGLLLLSAVLFPISEVPESYKPFVGYNPIAVTIEQARQVAVLGRMPDWTFLGLATLVGIASCWVGYVVFRRLRRNFADVL